jgi:hypothetical protein
MSDERAVAKHRDQMYYGEGQRLFPIPNIQPTYYSSTCSDACLHTVNAYESNVVQSYAEHKLLSYGHG